MKDFGTRCNLVVVLLLLATMLGCSALNATQPSAQLSTGLVTTAPFLDFGTVVVGDSVVRTNTIVNNSRSPLVLTRAQIDQTDFTIVGQKLPIRLAPGQRIALHVEYSPRSAGSSEGTVALASNLFRLPTIFGLKGTAISLSQLTLTPKSISFGNVPVGKTLAQSATLSNSGNHIVTITRAAISGQGFALTGIKLPLTLGAGQRVALGVSFAPVAGGAHSGTISLRGTTSVRFLGRGNRRRGTTLTDVALTTLPAALNVPVSGTGMASGQLAVSPPAMALGSVKLGATQTQLATLSNSGGSDVTISQATVTGRGFRMSGLSFPLKLSPGEKKNFLVTFTPQLAGTATGSVSVTSDAPNSVVVPVSGTGMAAGQLAVSPASLALGKVKLGATQTQLATLTNSGGSDVTISQATVTGRGFRMSGLSFPLKLSPGEKKNFLVTFTPQLAGTATGSVAVTSDAPNPVVVPVSAMAVAGGALISNPSSLNFGSVQVAHGQTLPATLTNSGGSSVTVSQANVSGSGFVITGLNLPVTLAAGQSTTYSVTFNPQSGGAASATLSLASDASDGTLFVPLAATGVTTGALNSAPASLSFGSVQLGNPKTLSGTLTNSGGTTITISQANAFGAGFVVNGLNLPATLAAGQSTSFSVTYTPQASGPASGSLAIVSDASNGTLTVPFTANTAGAGVLSTSDSSLDFGIVAVNGSGTQSETLTNTGGSSVTVTQAKVTGASFSVTGLALPLTLSAGQSFTFGTVFTPTTGGSATGSIAVVSNASNPTLTISLTGTASVSGQLAVSPATLNFGSVTVGQSKTLSGSLTASGSSITVSNASMSTSEFTVSGLALPLTLAAGKSAPFTVTFAPQASGTASASASFTSNASNPSAQQSLTGSGAAAPQHSVALTWNPSTSSVVGYNVYRGGTTGGPYSKIASMNADTSYTDSSVQAGQTYFYVTTAVDGAGRESANSNQTQAVIPTP